MTSPKHSPVLRLRAVTTRNAVAFEVAFGIDVVTFEADTTEKASFMHYLLPIAHHPLSPSPTLPLISSTLNVLAFPST